MCNRITAEKINWFQFFFFSKNDFFSLFKLTVCFKTDLKSVSGYVGKAGIKYPKLFLFNRNHFRHDLSHAVYVEHGSGPPDPHSGQGSG
jgi:hypothetical protein